MSFFHVKDRPFLSSACVVRVCMSQILSLSLSIHASEWKCVGVRLWGRKEGFHASPGFYLLVL